MRRARQRRWMTATALLALLSVGCGPELPLEVGVETSPIDLTYGAAADAEPEVAGAVAERPSGTGLTDTTFPGFISPPVAVTPPSGGVVAAPSEPDDTHAREGDETETTTPTVPVTSTTLPPFDDVDPAPVGECPAPAAGSRPDVAAPNDVFEPPAEGVYRFRRDGFLQTSSTSYEDARASEPVPLSEAVERQVVNVETRPATGGGEEYEYEVVQTESGMRTATLYVVRPDDGIFVKRVITQRKGLTSSPGAPPDTESFLPRPMIRIANLPLANEPNVGSPSNPGQSGAGVDPLSGVSMETYFHTAGRTLVQGCGEVFEAWKVVVDAGTFRRPGVRTFAFHGEFAVAPQWGGIVIADSITLSQGVNEYQGLYFHQESLTELNSDEPRPLEPQAAG